MSGLTKLSIAIVALLAWSSSAYAQDCAVKKTCSKMKSCKEATYYFKTCGHKARDRDGDGIPCEKLFGKAMSEYKKRLAPGK